MLNSTHACTWLEYINMVKFDGSVITNHSAAIGFIIRDFDGCPVVACAKKTTSYHVPTIEAIALREGLYLAR